MKARKTRSKIAKVKDNLGFWVDESAQIGKRVITDFTARFKLAQAGISNIDIEMFNLVIAEDNQSLLQPIQEAEIKEALFQMDKFKALGPNGFRTTFFQDHWHIIKDNVCQVVRSLFEDGKLLKQINHTLITLIPKVSQPATTAQFRPISLCNTIYKLLSKILANRMCLILEKIINPTQSAFVPKRSIHDNILLTLEIMNKFKNMKGKKAWVALKLDMEKTYDRVEWDFLFNTLRILGFHSG